MVTDAFEAITASRPCRARRSIGEALEELDLHAGTQFDPDCVRALRAIMSEGGVEEAGESTEQRPRLRAAA